MATEINTDAVVRDLGTLIARSERLTELQDGLHNLMGVWRCTHDALIRADTGRAEEAETLERCANDVQRVLRGKGPGEA